MNSYKKKLLTGASVLAVSSVGVLSIGVDEAVAGTTTSTLAGATITVAPTSTTNNHLFHATNATIATIAINPTQASVTATVNLKAANVSKVTGAVTTDDVASAVANLKVTGTGSVTFSSTIGTASNLIDTVNLDQVGTVTFGGNVFATSVTLDATTTVIDINDGVNITANITPVADEDGSILVNGDSKVTGNIGTSTNAVIGNLTLQGANGETFETTGDVFLKDLNWSSSSDAKIVIASGKTLESEQGISTTDSLGEISFTAGGTLTTGSTNNSIGDSATDKIRLITVNSAGTGSNTVTIDAGTGTIFADSIVYGDTTGSSTIQLGAGTNVDSAITTTTDGKGIFAINANGSNVTIDAAIGTSSKELATVNIDDTATGTQSVTFTSDIHAANVNFLGGTAATTAKVNFGTTVDGTVTVTTDGEGILSIDGNGTNTGDVTISDSIGEATNDALGTLNHTAGIDGSVLTLSGTDNFIDTFNIGAGQVELNGKLTIQSQILFNASAGSTGKITVADGKNLTTAGTNVNASEAGEGTIEFAGDSLVTGELGEEGAGNELALITINAGSVETTANVSATTINFAGNGELEIRNGNELEGAVTVGTDGDGTLNIVQGATVDGQVGTSAKKLGTINLGAINTGSTGATATAGTTTFSQDIYADTINFSLDSTLTATANKNITANITTTTDETGTLDINSTASTDSTTITGTVGAASAILKDINLGSTASSTVAFSGDVYTKNITAQAANTTTFNGDVYVGTDGITFGATSATIRIADGKSIKQDNGAGGDVVVTTTGSGTLTFLGESSLTTDFGTTTLQIGAINFNGTKTATVSGAATIHSDATTVANGATLKFGSMTSNAAAVSGTLTANGTVDIGVNTVTLGSSTDTDTFVLGSAGTLNVDVSSSANGLLVAEALTLNDGGTVNVNVLSGKTVAVGDVFNVARDSGNDSLSLPNTLNITTNLKLITFTAAAADVATTGTGNETLQLTAVSNTTAVTSLASAITGYSSQYQNNLNNAVGNLVLSGNSDELARLEQVLSGSSLQAMAEQVLPDTSGVTHQAALNSTNGQVSLIFDRVAQLRDASSGIATGGSMAKNGAWGELVANTADQDNRDDINGYQSDSWGVTFGFDTEVQPDTVVGLSLGYTSTEAEGTRTDTEIDSIQLTAYASKSKDNWYVNGTLGLALNEFDTTRTVGTDRLNGDFDGTSYIASVAGGYTLENVPGPLQVTPRASVTYALSQLDDYTETGSILGLNVDTDDSSKFETGLGLALEYPMTFSGVTYKPSLEFDWLYDFVGDEVETKSRFASGAATTFNSKGADIAQHTFVVGAGLDVVTQDNLTVSLDYDLVNRQDYESHNGTLNARFNF